MDWQAYLGVTALAVLCLLVSIFYWRGTSRGWVSKSKREQLRREAVSAERKGASGQR